MPVGFLWAGVEGGMVVFSNGFFVYLLCRRMNSADRNDLMPAPAQEKLEWVTPKISLMVAQVTQIKKPIVKKTEAETSIGPS